MTNRAQLSHLLLDVDFFDKPKIIDFRLTHGWIGISWLIRCYCLMSRATNGIVKRRIVEHLAEEMGVPRYEVVTVTCFESELMTLEGDMVSNSRVLKDQTKLYDRREKDREKVKKHRESKLVTVTEQLHNGNVTSNDTVFPVTDTVTEYIDINNNKIENKDLVVSEEEETPVQKMVKLALDEPNDQPWTRTNAYMLSGRRPMKKYPNIFLTPYEMEMVFNKYEPYTPEFTRLDLRRLSS